MQMMSVPLTAIEMSWLASLNLFFIPSIILTSAASTQLFSNSAFSMLFLFWTCVYLSSTMFSMLISSFMAKSSRATLVGVVIYFIGYFLSIFIDYTLFNPSILSILSLHPVVAISFGLQTIGHLEDLGIGIIQSTYSFSDNPSRYSFASCINSLAMDIAVLGILSLYLNRVVKGDFGRANSLYFPFQKSYWFPSSSRKALPKCYDTSDMNVQGGLVLEPVAETLREQANNGKSVEIYNLTKNFGQKKAVDNLTLSLYSGQVTALLGHNGAGKVRALLQLLIIWKISTDKCVWIK